MERISKLRRGRKSEDLPVGEFTDILLGFRRQNRYARIRIVENEVPDDPGKPDSGSQNTENGKFTDGFPDASGFAFFHKMHQENGRQRECHYGNI